MDGVVNLGDIVRRDAPEHTLVIDLRVPDAPVTLSAGELRSRIAAVARGLLARGYRAEDRVAIVSANRWEFLASYFGIMSAGLVAVPVNFRLARDTIAFILDDADVRAAIVDGEREALLPTKVPRIRLDPAPADVPGARDRVERERVEPRSAAVVSDDAMREGQSLGGSPVEALTLDSLLDPGDFEPVRPRDGMLAKILYTSGSTGRPKGVPLDHAGQLWALRKSFTGGDDALSQRSLIVAPTYHKNGLFFTSVAVSNGICFTSMPRFDARAYLQVVAAERCTLLSGIPTMFALMAREDDLVSSLDLSSVRMVTIGSAPLTDALLARVRSIFPNAVCQNGYGTTEAGPAVFGPHPDGRERPGLSLGYPYPDVGLRLTGGATPDEGVVHLRTPALMPGYLHLPEVSAARLRDGWYDTGDIMRRDSDGFFYFVGRADDMFVCGGENVYPGEVEKLLERCPGVAQAAVVPVPDEIKGAIPVAIVVSRADAELSEDAVKAFALANGPAYAHPRFVVFRDALPVASTHKIDRALLVDEARAYAEAHAHTRAHR